MGYSLAGYPNGFHSFPREGPNYASSRHPSMSSLRHPSSGEESSHGLITPEEQSHTYVNTASVEDDLRGRHYMHSLPEVHPQFSEPPRHHVNSGCSLEERNPQVYLQPGQVKFVLGPAPVYRHAPVKADSFCRHHRECGGHTCGPEREPPHNNNNECKDDCRAPKYAYENINGIPPTGSMPMRRGVSGRLKLTGDGLGFNSCAHRRMALLHYENLPSLPPVWECHPMRDEEDEEDEDEEDSVDVMTPSLNGYPDDPLQNYMNAESGGHHASMRQGDLPPHRNRTPNVFSFDFHRPCPDSRQLNYIQVELEKNDPHGRHTPQIPCTPVPTHSTRRADSYAVIDLKKTAAMSSLQRALPRDDGTSRKTRHNSTDLPL